MGHDPDESGEYWEEKRAENVPRHMSISSETTVGNGPIDGRMGFVRIGVLRSH